MSASAISSSSFFNYDNQTIHSKMQQFQQEFQQLGQDLQSGNLSAAQQDFVTLQQLGGSSASSSAQSSNPITQAFNQLAQDLQSGNLSAAQQDYSNIQQDFQNHAEQTQGHHHHHHGGGGGGSAISQLLSQLGQALQQSLGQTSGQASTQQSSSSNNISVSA